MLNLNNNKKEYKISMRWEVNHTTKQSKMLYGSKMSDRVLMSRGIKLSQDKEKTQALYLVKEIWVF